MIRIDILTGARDDDHSVMEPQLPKSVAPDDLIRKRVLPRFPVPADAVIAPVEGGLINQTFLISGAGPDLILQRVNPLFPPSIHDNIQAVTAALAGAGLVTPRLLPTVEGQLYLRLSGDQTTPEATVWRMMTHVAGVSFDVVTGTPQARAAGNLVARFHAALRNLGHEFVGLRASVHDTPRHMAHLQRTVAAHTEHRLFGPVSQLAQGVLASVPDLPALPDLPAQICHGDLKFNNLLFAGRVAPMRDRALCLIDLDTVGPMALAFEMGDAWRSWCNRNDEDHEHADLDLAVFESSLDGYREGLGRALTRDERRALLAGPEWISLELSARFAADALAESYFGWNPRSFAGRGEHNLARARGQLSLFRALVDSRPERARLLSPP